MPEEGIAGILARTDRPIAITGAGGWLGLATLDLLERALGQDFARRVHCFGSAARTLELGEGRSVSQQPLAELAALRGQGAWVLHYAFQTKDRAETMSEEAYRAANGAISAMVLDALDRIDAAGIFVASSGAATRADDPAASPAMRLYGALKRDDEDRFAGWAETRGRRAVIGRIFNVTGPYINKHHAYAMASFIIDALAGRAIAVRAPRPVFRGYVAIRELMTLVFALLGEASEGVIRFETGGETLELGEVAATVSDALGGAGVDRAPVIEPDEDRYAGDSATYGTLLARHGIAPVALRRQVIETARWLAATGRQGGC